MGKAIKVVRVGEKITAETSKRNATIFRQPPSVINSNASKIKHQTLNPKSGTSTSSSSKISGSRRLSALQNKFVKKLQGSRFRFINESIYTKKGSETYEEFQQNPCLFTAYHEGFREQASQWPINPLDGIIDWIKSMDDKLVIADMGCGDAQLSQSVSNTVYSFDLVSTSPLVIAADIAHVPLQDNFVDVVVFCLSLMGTNIGDFILEASRILKPGGIMKIVEVRSRFEKEKDGIKKFIRVVKRAGFQLSEEKSVLNTMFFMLQCTKLANSVAPETERVVFTAKPCLYKKR